MGRVPCRRTGGLPVGGTLLILLVVTVAAGCASTGSQGDDSGGREQLSQEAILGVGASNLYDVVQRLRPEWLRVTSGEAGRRTVSSSDRSWSPRWKIVVIYNGSRIGEVEVLRQMAPEGVARMRYEEGEFSGSTLVGSRDGYVEGAIVIETMR